MEDTENTSITEQLLKLREKIDGNVDAILQGLIPYLAEEKQAIYQANLSDLKRIHISGTNLKKELAKLLDKSAIENSVMSSTMREYLTKVRHDLNNLISSMLGFSEIVSEDFQKSRLSDEESQFAEFIAKTKQILKWSNEIRVSDAPQAHIMQSPIQATRYKANLSAAAQAAEDVEFQYFKDNFSILIVDDNDENCQLLDKYVKGIGFRNTQIAHDGFQAMAVRNRFDLLLLDIDMPGMSGIEVLKRLKEAILQRQVMVLMITAADTIENATDCIQLGAEDFLPKPFNKDLLRVRIGACIEKKWFIHQESVYREHLHFERERYEKLLHALFPPVIVQELTETGKIQACYYNNVAIIFADVVSFTPYCDSHELPDIIQNLQKFAEICEVEANHNNVQKIKTIGDCFLGVSGLLMKSQNPVLDCINFATKLIANCEKLPSKWQLRVGIHYGNVIGGIVGHRQYLFDIWGDAVNTASRIQAVSEPNKICLSKPAWDLIQEFSRGQSLGEVKIKGKSPIEIYVYEGKKSN